jgi:hypothetical protein
MWPSIQRHVFEAASREYPASRVLTPVFALLEALGELQSSASQGVPGAARCLDAVAHTRAELESLLRRLGAGGASSPDEWLALAYLGDARAELERVWGELYAPLCAAHPELAAPLAELRRWLAELPLAAALSHIERAWGEAGADPLVDAIAAICLVDLPARAADASYRRLLDQLDLRGQFLSVMVAACALERLVASGRLELAAVPERALAALSLLSNFHAFESGSWG